jgi:hypothetical protein
LDVPGDQFHRAGRTPESEGGFARCESSILVDGDFIALAALHSSALRSGRGLAVVGCFFKEQNGGIMSFLIHSYLVSFHETGGRMYLEIKSQSDVAYWADEKSPRGPWVNDKPTVTISRTAPEHIGRPPWHIEISIQHELVLSSGERSGGERARTVVRMAELHITPSDLDSILEVALREGLISVTIKS